MDKADLVLLKTHSLNKILQTESYDLAKIIVGFPYSFQLAAKHLFWQNILSFYGKNAAEKLSPYTVRTDRADALLLLSELLEESGRIILKSNFQRRAGLKLIYSLDELRKTKLSDYVVGQKIIEDSLRIKTRRFNLRVYIAVFAHEGKARFYLYPTAKIVYADAENGLITSNDHFHKSLPITSNKAFQKALGFDWYSPTLDALKKILSAHKTFFSKQLRPNIRYYDHFGADVLFDAGKTPLFLEFNRSPSLKWKYQKDYWLKKDMLDAYLNAMAELKELEEPWVRLEI